MGRLRSEIFFQLCLIALIFFFIGQATAAGTETPISTLNNNWNHQLPKIYSDQIVWWDSNPANTVGIISLYNITSGLETQVTDTIGHATNPAIYGGHITYTACGSGSLCAHSASTIYLYDITTATRTPISSGSDWQDYPAVYDNRVVWQDLPSSGNYRIYRNSIPPAAATLVLDTNNDPNNSPALAIYGDQVVWVNWSLGYPEICLYNLTSNQETSVTTPNPGSWEEGAPAIYSNRVVWMDSRNTGDYEIFINGTSSGDEYSLTPNEPSSHYYPAISGNWVVWYQTNITPGHSDNSDIVVNDTSTHQKIPIALDRNIIDAPSISYSPADSVYRIVWDEKDASGNYNVHLYTSGPTMTCPVAGFTNDFAGGTAPVVVHFQDASTYSSSNPITHWFWAFGDGSNSGTLNVGSTSHTYTNTGSHDVSLTVSNPYCRNTTTVTSDVVVGSPLPDFTASPTTDIVPVTIVFTDTSRGTPTQWNWSWGDGTPWTNGTTQNPTHSYKTPGSFTVTLITSNAYGSNTKTRTGYITALAGANESASTTMNGITFQDLGSWQYMNFDTATLSAWTFNPGRSMIEFTPPADRGFQNISMYTTDTGGFQTSGTTITGNISSVHVQTKDIIPTGFSASACGQFNCTVNYSIDLTTYPENAVLNTKVWEGATSSDAANFNYIAAGSHFAGTNGTAYTIKVVKTGFPSSGSAKVHMSVNASLVASKPLGRNEVYLERITDDGKYGQILGTRFLYHNSTENLDYFETDSPNGLSTFGVSFLEGAGNPLQLIALSVANYISEPGNGGSGDSGEAGGIVSGPAQRQQAGPVQEPNPAPADPGKTANLYINANAVITQATTLKSTDARATLTLGQGVVAKSSDGKALSSVTIRSVPSTSLSDLPQDTTVSFAGIAYDLGPNGATFSPAISLTFSFPEARWNQDYTIKGYDPATKTWNDLPTVYSSETSTVTTSVSHFCCFALFSKAKNPSLALKGPPENRGNPLPTPTLQSPPTTAVNIFIDMILWVFGLAEKNLLLIVIAVVLVLLYYGIRRKKRRDRIRYML